MWCIYIVEQVSLKQNKRMKFVGIYRLGMYKIKRRPSNSEDRNHHVLSHLCVVAYNVFVHIYN